MSETQEAESYNAGYKPLALSIRQPWAWAILHAEKDIENRTWNTRRRGRFLIHAPRQIDHDAYDLIFEISGYHAPRPEHLELGGIVGVVDLVMVVTESDSPWFTGPFGFVLRHPMPTNFQPCGGKLGFFRPGPTPPPPAQRHLFAR